MFSQLEFLIAFRYLRSKRSEGFISIIAGFSLVGIILGVATLIIVMSVMNGFRAELIGRILGLNGHIGIYENQNNFLNYDEFSVGVAEIAVQEVNLLRLVSVDTTKIHIEARQCTPQQWEDLWNGRI